jgi:hypothetical protein
MSDSVSHAARSTRSLAVLSAFAAIFIATSAHAAGLSIRLVSITSPIPPGARVTVIVATEKGATCAGEREAHAYNKVPLRAETVGENGRAQWDWNVLPGRHPGGVRKVHIACSKGGRSGAVNTVFDVR